MHGQNPTVCLSVILEQIGSVEISVVNDIQTDENVDLLIVNDFEISGKIKC